jgi:hypothetical protein
MSKTAGIREHKGGAPQKAEGGLKRVLFIRTDEALVRQLEEYQARYREREKVVLSIAEVARKLMRDAIESEKVNRERTS